VNVLVLDQLTDDQRSALAAMLDRCRAADGYAPLSEVQREAARHSDLGHHGIRVVAAFDGPSLVGAAFLTPAADHSVAIHMAIDPDHRGDGDVGPTLLGVALDETSGERWLWVIHAEQADDAAVRPFGFEPERDVLQMTVPLPLPDEIVAATRPVATRPFKPPQDEQPWLAVNNLAFAGHPEQGDWTLDQLHDRLAAPWVDLDGFLVADAPDGNGLIGSCWTKVHATVEPVVGEIYVISVNPDHHGQGWGRALTVAGLQWLSAQGISIGMLYTSASNTTAVALYHSLGFTIDHVDRAYRLAE
jgi:mycothiol synthase